MLGVTALVTVETLVLAVYVLSDKDNAMVLASLTHREDVVAAVFERFKHPFPLDTDLIEAISHGERLFRKLTLDLRSINAIAKQDLVNAAESVLAAGEKEEIRNFRRYVVKQSSDAHKAIDEAAPVKALTITMIKARAERDYSGPKRKFAFKKIVELERFSNEFDAVQKEWIDFLWSEIEVPLQRKLLEFARELSGDSRRIRSDLIARYPKVTEFLAR